MRPAWVEIDLAALRFNVRQIREHVGADRTIIAVVKANAYGHGLVPIARHVLAHGANAVAVAIVDEALELRTAGVEGRILTLGAGAHDVAKELVEARAEATVCCERCLRALSREAERAGVEVGVHVKLNTGMNRMGLSADEALHCLQVAGRLPGIRLIGLSSHLATADEANGAWAAAQLRCLRALAERTLATGIDIPEVHIANSAATERSCEMHLDAVRPGLSLYGLSPLSDEALAPIMRRPVLSIHSVIATALSVRAGEAVGYARSHVVSRDSRVAVVPVGYADGIDRRLSGNGDVLVGGARAPIVGRICMDQMSIDITDIPEATEGSPVTLIGGVPGGDAITVAEICDRTGMIAHEVVATIGPRLRRVYVNDIPPTE